MKWQYYLRDDALVFRANDRRVEFWGLDGWTISIAYRNVTELLKCSGVRLEKISSEHARKLR